MWIERTVVIPALAVLMAGLLMPTCAHAVDAIEWKANGTQSEVTAAAVDETFDGATQLDELDTVPTVTSTDTAGGVDANDGYAVWLYAGEQISIELAPPAGSDWGIALYGPDAEGLASQMLPGSVPPLSLGGPGGSPLVTGFMAADSGMYYIVVSADSGSGSYQLTTTLARLSTDVGISIVPMSQNLYARPFISGFVIDRLGRRAPGTVFLYSSYDLINWFPVSSTFASVGYFSLVGEYQYRKTYYMATFEGNSLYCTSSQTTRAVETKTRVGNAVAPSTMKVGKKYTVYSLLEPRHTPGGYPVRIQKYKKVGGSWQWKGDVKAKAYDYGNSTSKCKVSMSLSSKGSWRLRAYSPKDSRHQMSFSRKNVYVTVK